MQLNHLSVLDKEIVRVQTCVNANLFGLVHLVTFSHAQDFLQTILVVVVEMETVRLQTFVGVIQGGQGNFVRFLNASEFVRTTTASAQIDREVAFYQTIVRAFQDTLVRRVKYRYVSE